VKANNECGVFDF
jgi:hypothetical protein